MLPYFPHATGWLGGFAELVKPVVEWNDEGENQSDDDDIGEFQSFQWEVILNAIGSKDAPTLLPPDYIKICGGSSWSPVFNLIRAPIKTTPEMLEEADAYKSEGSLQEAGVCKEDIPVILDACKQLECSDQQKNPSIGEFGYYGNEAHG